MKLADLKKLPVSVARKLVIEYSKLDESNYDYLFANTGFLAMSGSKIYGANLYNSDHDFVGIVFPDFKQLMGLEKFESINNTGNSKEKTKEGEVDLNLISLTKLVKNYLGGQTKAIELIHVNKEFVVYESKEVKLLRAELPKYRTTYSVNSFIGSSNKAFKSAKKEYDKGEHNLAHKYMYQAINFLYLGQKYMTSPNFVTYYEENANHLLDIREGLFKNFDEFEKEWLDSKNLLNEVAEKSSLPKNVSHKEVTDLLVSLQKMYLNI